MFAILALDKKSEYHAFSDSARREKAGIAQ